MALTTVQAAMGGTGLTSFPAPSTSGNVLTSDGTNWTSAASGGLGSGQTWQNMTSSRTSGTTYTNSTGKPIAISAYTDPNAYTGIVLYVNGSVINREESGFHPGSSARNSTFTIVPNGVTYRIDYVGVVWELR